MSRVLILTGDKLGRKLAGPAIRALEMAKILSETHEVVLGCHKIEDTFSAGGFRIEAFGDEPSSSFTHGFDVILVPGSMKLHSRVDCPVIVDLYDPFILSNLERLNLSDTGRITFDRELNHLLLNLTRGDFFICAGERQWDFWTGMLTALGRINPEIYRADRTIRSFLDIVPFGIPDEPPGLKKEPVFPNHRDGDAWLLWGGGIWNWFDPLTLIQAIKELDTDHIKLFFMGTSHPDPRIPQMAMARKAIELSEKLSLKNRNIFFGDWIPYGERQYFLTQAVAGVSTHFPHIETRFSFRTRILDYIWGRLPVICTEGDALADLVQSEGIGVTVPPEDAGRLADAIRRIVFDEAFRNQCRSNLEELAGRFTWRRAVEPVSDFCNHPRRAPDDASRQAFLKRHALSPAGGCESKNEPVGELADGAEVIQTFKPSENGLYRIELMFGTYMRVNTGRLVVQLAEKNTGINLMQQSVDMRNIPDNQWYPFVFSPISDSAGKSYELRLTAPAARPGDTVTVWSDSTAPGYFLLNNRKQNGSLAFRYYCRSAGIPEATPEKEGILSRLWRRIKNS